MEDSTNRRIAELEAENSQLKQRLKNQSILGESTMSGEVWVSWHDVTEDMLDAWPGAWHKQNGAGADAPRGFTMTGQELREKLDEHRRADARWRALFGYWRPLREGAPDRT